AFEPVRAQHDDVPNAALLELGEDRQPELRALGGGDPHAENLFAPLDANADGHVDRAVLHDALVADLHHQRIDVDDGIDLLEGAKLPGAELLDDLVGDAADQVAAHLDAVNVGQVRLDVAHRHAPGVHG